MLLLLLLFIISVFRDSTSQIPHETITPLLIGEDVQSVEIILKTTVDIIHDSNERVDSLYAIKQDNMRSAPFEIGYLVNVIQEKYRKMVDKYNTSYFMNTTLYLMEHVMYLQEIEHHYWEIEHLCNMAHEIERKYKIMASVLHEDYNDYVERKKVAEKTTLTSPVNPYGSSTTKKIRGFDMEKFKKKYMSEGGLLIGSNRPTKKRGRGKFPLEYGWDVDGLP